MQHVNQLIYAIFFAFALKLSFGSFLDFKYKKAYLSSHVYWTLAAASIAISFLSWAIAPFFSYALLSIAGTGLVASMAFFALLFRSFNTPISKNLLMIIIGVIIAFAIQFEFFRSTGNYFGRSITSTILVNGCLIWQLIELKHIVKKNASIHLKSILILILAMICLTLLRLYEIQIETTSFTQNIYDESFIMFALRSSFAAGQVLMLVTLSNYFYEQLWIKANDKLNLKENQMLSSLKSLSLARDNETGNHIVRTQHYVKILATRLKNLGHYTEELSDEAIEELFKAAPLHDIGKVGIPDEILLKPSKLTPSEWEVMKTHTTIGESVLGAAETAINTNDNEDVITKAIRIAGGHHEHWDGSGYPRGLKGQEIPLEARIMSLADMYDALISERVYKKAWSHESAVKEIVSKRNTQFDPVIVDAFLLEIDQFNQVSQSLKD